MDGDADFYNVLLRENEIMLIKRLMSSTTYPILDTNRKCSMHLFQTRPPQPTHVSLDIYIIVGNKKLLKKYMKDFWYIGHSLSQFLSGMRYQFLLYI